MKTILKVLSAIALGLTVVPCLLVFAGKISLNTHYFLMGIGMALWFLTAPFWIKKDTML